MPPLVHASAGSTFEPTEHRDTHDEQTGGGVHAQERIRRDHLEHVPHNRRQRADATSNGTQATGDSLTLKSFLLSHKIMVAGPGIEPDAPDSEPGVLPMHHPAIEEAVTQNSFR